MDHFSGLNEESMTERKSKLLRIAFIAGAITDAFALLPMLLPSMANFLWGLDAMPGSFWFAMHDGAALMLGWTALLVWAAIRPVERQFVALLTALVIAGLVLAEAAAVHASTIGAGRMAVTWVLQAILFLLFAGAYFVSPGRSNQAG
jgi:hypothetical protein